MTPARVPCPVCGVPNDPAAPDCWGCGLTWPGLESVVFGEYWGGGVIGPLEFRYNPQAFKTVVHNSWKPFPYDQDGED